jgi:hypothetical protein
MNARQRRKTTRASEEALIDETELALLFEHSEWVLVTDAGDIDLARAGFGGFKKLHGRYYKDLRWIPF